MKLLNNNLSAAITGHVNCMESLRKSVELYQGSTFTDRPDENVRINNLRHIGDCNNIHDKIPDIDYELDDNHIFPSFVELYKALERGEIDLISIAGIAGLPILRDNYYSISGSGDDIILLYKSTGGNIQLTWGDSDSRTVNGFALPVERFNNLPTRSRGVGTNRLFYDSIEEWLGDLFTDHYCNTIDIDLSDELNPDSNRVTIKGIVNGSGENKHYYLSKSGKISFTSKQETAKVTTNTNEQAKQETSEMKNTNNLVGNILAANKGAAINAAEMEAGRAINARITAVFGDKIKLPMGMGGMLKTPVGQVVLANLFAVLVKQYLPENALANRAADGAVKSAAYEVLRDIDISGMIAEVFEGVKVGGTAVNAADRPKEINID